MTLAQCTRNSLSRGVKKNICIVKISSGSINGVPCRDSKDLQVFVPNFGYYQM